MAFLIVNHDLRNAASIEHTPFPSKPNHRTHGETTLIPRWRGHKKTKIGDTMTKPLKSSF